MMVKPVLIAGVFIIFVVLNYQIMTLKKLLPVLYGGSIRKDCNALIGVEHLTYTGFIFSKLSDYECKTHTRYKLRP